MFPLSFLWCRALYFRTVVFFCICYVLQLFWVYNCELIDFILVSDASTTCTTGSQGCYARTTARTSSGHDECRRGCSHCGQAVNAALAVVQQAPPQAPVAAPVQAHAFPSAWERVRDAFQKAHPPEFAGSSNVVVSSQWRKDIQRHLRMYECTEV